MKTTLPVPLTIHAALVEIRDLAIGDAATRKAKWRELLRDRPRLEQLARVARLLPTLRDLIQTGVRLADDEPPLAMT
jgi:hypothetical protein